MRSLIWQRWSSLWQCPKLPVLRIENFVVKEQSEIVVFINTWDKVYINWCRFAHVIQSSHEGQTLPKITKEMTTVLMTVPWIVVRMARLTLSSIAIYWRKSERRPWMVTRRSLVKDDLHPTNHTIAAAACGYCVTSRDCLRHPSPTR